MYCMYNLKPTKMKTDSAVLDKRTKEYKFIVSRIREIENIKNRQSVINIGYHPIMTGLRVKDVNLFHSICFN